MKQLLKYISASLALSALLVACKKDENRFDLQDGAFTEPTLTSSASTIVLSTDTDEDTVVRFSWKSADFGTPSVITYTLQFDTPADSTSGWHNARNFPIGTSLYKAFSGKELNSFLNEMNLPTGSPNRIVFRVKADVNQYNGAQSTVPSIYTSIAPIDITSYGQSLRVPGDYQGWTPATAPLLAPVKGAPGHFEGYVYMEDPGMHYFKYTNAPDWDHINYGDGGGGTFSTDGAAGGLSVATGGYYELTANTNPASTPGGNRWTATKTTWGVIGDASPGGWDNDTPMTYDPVSQTWSVTLNMVTAGSFKFRANGGWAINFGIDNDGKLFYADNPFFGSVALNNLTVPENGNYTMTLDLHVPGEYTYTAVKN